MIVFASVLCGCVALGQMMSDYNMAMSDPATVSQVQSVGDTVGTAATVVAGGIPAVAPWAKPIGIGVTALVSVIGAVWCGYRKRKGGDSDAV